MGGLFAVLHVITLPGPTGPGPRVSSSRFIVYVLVYIVKMYKMLVYIWLLLLIRLVLIIYLFYDRYVGSPIKD